MDAPSKPADILVVDDEEEIRILLYTLFTENGHNVRTASDGQAGLDMLKERAAEVVVLDLRMPGMNGLEFIEATWALDERPKIIMLTGYATIDVAMEAARLGITALCEKPFVTNNLINLVDRAVSEKRTETGKDFPIGLGAESEEILANTRRLMASLKKRLVSVSQGQSEPGESKEEKSITFGPPGKTRLPSSVVIVDLVEIDSQNAAAGVFVDDGGAAVYLTITSPFDTSGRTISLRRIPQGVSYVKVRPLSTNYNNYFHFKDQRGSLIEELSCALDVGKRCLVELEDPFDILGLDVEADLETVEFVYKDLCSRYDPENAPRGMKLEARAALSKLSEAFSRIRLLRSRASDLSD